LFPTKPQKIAESKVSAAGGTCSASAGASENRLGFFLEFTTMALNWNPKHWTPKRRRRVLIGVIVALWCTQLLGPSRCGRASSNG